MKKVSIILFALSMSLSLWAQTTIPSGTEVPCGKTVRITATANEGYEFDYWEDEPTNTNPVREVPVNDVVNLKAIFKLKENTLNPAAFMAETGEGTITIEVNGISTNIVKKGDVVKIIATSTDDCREFDYWDGLATDDSQYNSPTYTFDYQTESTVPAIKAVYKTKEFTVTAEAQDGAGTIVIEVL